MLIKQTDYFLDGPTILCESDILITDTLVFFYSLQKNYKT